MSHNENAAGVSPFEAEEAARLRLSDRQAARHIVWLMVGIFILGLGLYSVVALFCANVL